MDSGNNSQQKQEHTRGVYCVALGEKFDNRQWTVAMYICHRTVKLCFY